MCGAHKRSKEVKRKKIYPIGKPIIIELCFFDLPILIIILSIGISLVVVPFEEYINSSDLIGIIIIILSFPVTYSLNFSARSYRRLEFKDDHLILRKANCEYLAPPYTCYTIPLQSLAELKAEDKIFILKYSDGTVLEANLKNFSRKQIHIIKVEILKKACQINHCAVNLIN